MIVKIWVVGVFQENTIILGCDEKKEGILIDPGGESSKIIKEAEKERIDIKGIYLTHSHIDHIMDIENATSILNCPVFLHEGDIDLYKNSHLQAQFFGIKMKKISQDVKKIEDGDIFNVGNIKVKVIHTPGHSPGSCCFFINNKPPILISGDTLFYMGIGRTDLLGGSHNQLMKSIKEKLFQLPDDTIVYPGHGPQTKIRDEKLDNPFFKNCKNF